MVSLTAALAAGCGFDSARSKQPSQLVAPVISQPDMHRAQIDAVRREMAQRDDLDSTDEAVGTARLSPEAASSARIGASLSSDPPDSRSRFGAAEPWERNDLGFE